MSALRHFAFLGFLVLVLTLHQAASAATLSLTPFKDHWVAVLMFHQVSNNPVESAAGVDHISKPWLSPAQFDHVLTNLTTHGYHVITLAQALAAISGKGNALPAKPVILTFDDGYRSAWTQATPILKRHHDVATMFFEGHATDNPRIPRRLSSAELRAMARSGIWSVQSHGFAGHSDLLISANGATSPYWYANLAWLPALHRFETVAEFTNRIRNDLLRFRKTFQPITGTTIDVFAYPSGEYGQNAPSAPGEDHSIRIQAGDSNAPHLRNAVFSALKSAGFIAAFAVSNYGGDHLADATNTIYAIPRIGVNATFNVNEITPLITIGSELPEIADGHYADVGPVIAIPGGLLAASTDAPTIFSLNHQGQLQKAASFPALLAGRDHHRSLIRGMSYDHGVVTILQQKGSYPGATPMLSTLQLRGHDLSFLSSRPLPAAMNWIVGMATFGQHLVALDGSCTLFDVTTGTRIASISGLAPSEPHVDPFSRCTGLAATSTTLLTYDSGTGRLIAFHLSGTITAAVRIDAPVHDLAMDGTTLLATVWEKQRRTLRRFTLEYTP